MNHFVRLKKRTIFSLPDTGEEMGRKGFLKIEGEVLQIKQTIFQFKQLLYLRNVPDYKNKIIFGDALYLLPLKLLGVAGVDPSNENENNQ